MSEKANPAEQAIVSGPSTLILNQFRVQVNKSQQLVRSIQY